MARGLWADTRRSDRSLASPSTMASCTSGRTTGPMAESFGCTTPPPPPPRWPPTSTPARPARLQCEPRCLDLARVTARMRGCSAVYTCACGPGCERVWRVACGLTRVDRIAVWLHRLRWQAVLPGGRRDPWQRALGVRLRHHHRLDGRRHQRRRDRLGSSASRDASTSHVSLRACGAAARCIRALAVQGVSACGAWPVS